MHSAIITRPLNPNSRITFTLYKENDKDRLRIVYRLEDGDLGSKEESIDILNISSSNVADMSVTLNTILKVMGD